MNQMLDDKDRKFSESGIVKNTQNMEREKKCKQKKCPVDCLMSAWSGWSKCTKDCESGVEAKTRSVLTKPKNGGKGCDSVQEERPCNTGSCDVTRSRKNAHA